MIDPDEVVWYSGSGDSYTFAEVIEKITETKKDNNSLEIHIGTDSDPNGKKYAIATGIALRIPGHGACYFWSRDYLNANQAVNIGFRLEREVADSIVVAEHLKKLIEIDIKIIIHVDCNAKLNHASGKYAKKLTSYAAGMGYPVKIKPDSWAASSLADKHAKSYVLPENERD